MEHTLGFLRGVCGGNGGGNGDEIEDEGNSRDPLIFVFGGVLS